MDSVYFQDGEVLVNFKDSQTPNEYYQWLWKHYERLTICKECVGGKWSNFYNQCVSSNVPATVAYKYRCAESCWSFYGGKTINIFADKLYNGKQINGLAVAKVPAYNNYYLQLDTRYINESYYNYLQALKIQTETIGTLFDVPTLTKFNFNIHCTNDENEQVLGIFRVFATNRQIFYLKTQKLFVEYIDPKAIEEVPPVYAPCEETASRTKIAPQGWRE
jgi:Domain of unknown function (DUF4249)